MSGKLIVLEGIDGSGKATQARLLCQRLGEAGIAFREIDFPRYGKPSAAMVQEYLNGNLGRDPGDVNAYAASMFYAMDRYASFKQDCGGFYQAGGLVVADRYTTSNAVHQAAKLPAEERESYLAWLFDTEYRLLGLPAPDLVLYLDMPASVTEAMMRRREAAAHIHGDIHEQDGVYQARCRENAGEIAAGLGWQVVNCAREGTPRDIRDIHQEIWGLVQSLL